MKAHSVIRCLFVLLSLFAYSQQTAQAAESSVLIENITLIDGTGAPAQPGTNVLVTGSRIVRVCQCDMDAPADAPADALVIDGTGKFLIPGLMDTHIHLEGGRSGAVGADRALINDTETGRRMLHGYLYSGVTGVYGSGNHGPYIFGLRADERAGRILSPRIYATGRLFAMPGGYASNGGGYAVATYEDGVAALNELFTDQPDLVKFIRARRMVGGSTAELPTIGLGVLTRMIAYANSQGFRTTVHAVDATAAMESVAAGINAMAHPVYMTPTGDDLAPLIAAKGIPVSTSLVVLRNIFQLVDDPSFFDEPLFVATLSEEDLQHHKGSESKRYRASGMDRWARQAYAYARENVQKLYAAGAVLALGTDRTIGAMVHQELELLVEAGIPPLEVIRMGTLNAALYVGAEDRLGSIEPGKIADMVVLSENPLADIRNSRSIHTVILGGQPVDRSALDLPVNW